MKVPFKLCFRRKCPACGNTKRQFVKDLAKDLELQNKGVKKRLFTAVQKSEIQGWKLE